MQREDKQRARELRTQGWSYNDILQEVSVSKSTLSLWLRDIPLTDEQIAALLSKQDAGREKFIRSTTSRRNDRWAEYHAEAEAEYAELSKAPAFMFGLALYIGEGSKTQPNSLRFANCDPRVIRRGLQFFLKIGLLMPQIRCAVHLHPNLDVAEAEAYWQEATGLLPLQFYKTTVALSRASTGNKTNVQRYGTCHLVAHQTRTRQKLAKWMELALKDGPLV